MSTFQIIKKIAKEKGFTLTQLAKKAGLSPNSLYRYNQGVSPKISTLKKISNVLGVPLEELSCDLHDNSNDHGTTVDLSDTETPMSFKGTPLTNDDKDAIKVIIETLINEHHTHHHEHETHKTS